MNSVQRNFKKQMNKSLKKLKRENKDIYYKYLTKNHLHNPKQELSEQGSTKRVLRFIGKLIKLVFISVLIIIAIMIVVALLTDKKSNTTNIQSNSTAKSNLSVTKKNNIINYVNSLGTIENSITKDLNARNEDATSLNNKRMTAKEYKSNLTVYKNRILDDIQQIEKLNCPEELAAYRTELINSYGVLSQALKLELDYMQTGNKNNLKECQKLYKTFNESSNGRATLINSILDKYGIQHN